MGNNYRLGLVSISFRKHTPEEILRVVRDAGLSCVEWGSDVHAPCHDDERLKQIAALQKEYGIECSSYGTYFYLGCMALGELRDYIRAAKMLGTDTLRLWCGNKSGLVMTPEQKQAMLEESRRAAKMAEEEGVTLCMECHQETLTESPDVALWLMEQVNSPSFRMYWQPFQQQTKAEHMDYAKRLAPYTKHLHVFQWTPTERLPLRTGIETWRDYLTNFDTPRTLLLEFMPDDRIETLAAEAEALKMITGVQ